VKLDNKELTGLITYMHTDGVQVRCVRKLNTKILF
jgi:hypothetical protein